jgi:histidine triad (HIT) family protein
MQDSIFTKIIKGEIPSHKVYEDELTFAFLDIHPTTPGHTLVIPKVQIAQLWDLEKKDYDAVMATTQKVALNIREKLRPKRVGMQLMGLDVNHAHVHLVPFNTIDEYYHRPDMNADPDHAALGEMAKKLAF